MEGDLEGGEARIDVVVGLAAHPSHFVEGFGTDCLGLGHGDEIDLVLGQHAQLLLTRLGDESIRFATALGNDGLPLGEQLVGVGEGARQGITDVVDEVEHHRAVDHARRRQRDGLGLLDEHGELFKLLIDVHEVPPVDDPTRTSNRSRLSDLTLAPLL